MDLIIDKHGRTVKEYIQMPGSPIRPYYAKKVLGISINTRTEFINLNPMNLHIILRLMPTQQVDGIHPVTLLTLTQHATLIL